MAKAVNKTVRKKRKERKHIEKGQAHIFVYIATDLKVGFIIKNLCHPLTRWDNFTF